MSISVPSLVTSAGGGTGVAPTVTVEAEGDPSPYFNNLSELAKLNNLKELSMGMSNDYECAINNGATFVRVSSKIFSSD